MDKISSLLGFAQRAGSIASGEQAVEAGLRRGKVHLLVIAQDSSENTKSKFVAMAKNFHVACEFWTTKDNLGLVIGKNHRAVVGVTDRKFAKAIREALRSQVGEKN